MRVIQLAIVVVLATIAFGFKRGPTWKELDGYTFEKWLVDFDRAYEDSATFIRRRAIFNTRLQDIKRHNADPEQTYKRGVNQFSDWTTDEWKAYNRYRPDELFEASNARRGEPVVPEGVKLAAAIQALAADSLPEKVDYTTWTSPRVLTGIKNQGKCGNCWSWSATESVESYYALLTGQLPVLSSQQITSCDVNMDGCGGGSIRSGWNYVKNSTGLYEEWVYPFTDFFAIHDRKNYTSKCRNITKEFAPSNWTASPVAGVSGYHSVERNSANATMHALATRGPLSIGVASALWIDYEGGILKNNASHGGYATWDNWGIDHAVQLVGYSHDFDLGINYWLVKNSWGTDWGEDGFIRLYRPEVEPCGIYPVNNKTVCGTSALLAEPSHPYVHTLKKQH